MWLDIGSSFLPSDILGAYLFAQLEVKDLIQSKRKRIWDDYWNGLGAWANNHNVRLPFIPDHCTQAYHMFYLLMPSLEIRSRLIRHLKANSILAVFHYLPLHLSPMGQRYGGRSGQYPISEDVSDRILRLPFYNGMTPGETARVVDTVLGFDGW
jgi:dTDP-4-amino-4,6-dideoxygalactose transaminase